MDDEEQTAELKRQQDAKERVERREAEQSSDDTEAAAHLRRAEKAAYLSEKLAERERSDSAQD